MTTFTHQLLSRKNINPRSLIMRVRIFQPQCYGVRCCVALGLCRSGKLDTMWRGAWQRLATRHQEGMWPFQMVTAAGRCFLSHGQKHPETCSVTTCSSLSQTFSHRIAMIWTRLTCHLGCSSADGLPSSKFPLSWQNEESDCQSMAETTAWRSRCQFTIFYHLFMYG